MHAVAMVLEIINGVNMGYKKSSRGSKKGKILPLYAFRATKPSHIS